MSMIILHSLVFIDPSVNICMEYWDFDWDKLRHKRTLADIIHTPFQFQTTFRL